MRSSALAFALYASLLAGSALNAQQPRNWGAQRKAKGLSDRPLQPPRGVGMLCSFEEPRTPLALAAETVCSCASSNRHSDWDDRFLRLASPCGCFCGNRRRPILPPDRVLYRSSPPLGRPQTDGDAYMAGGFGAPSLPRALDCWMGSTCARDLQSHCERGTPKATSSLGYQASGSQPSSTDDCVQIRA